MGRPKGSKNKSTVAAEEVVVSAKKPATPVKAVEKKAKTQLTLPVENVAQTKAIITATAELALTAGRIYVVDKITAWKADVEHDKLEVIMGDGDVIQYDEFILYFDGEKVDSKHVMHADVRDVVAGVLGLRA